MVNCNILGSKLYYNTSIRVIIKDFFIVRHDLKHVLFIRVI